MSRRRKVSKKDKEKPEEIEVKCNCPVCNRSLVLILETFGVYTVPEHDRYKQKGRRCPFSGEEINIKRELFINNISPGFKGNDRVKSVKINVSKMYNEGAIGLKIEVKDTRKALIPT